jgi:hypothetical protein
MVILLLNRTQNVLLFYENGKIMPFSLNYLQKKRLKYAIPFRLV